MAIFFCRLDDAINNAVSERQIKHLKSQFKRKEEWVVGLRVKLPGNEHLTNNLCERAIRVLKESVLR